MILCIFAFTSNAQNIKFPALKAQIDSLAFIDQKVQEDTRKANTEDKSNLEKVQKETFIRHTKILKNILKKYGFPNFDMVGEKGSSNYWLCVQHCDHDPKFQNEVLILMKKQLKKKKANARNYAYLRDRVNINTGKKQIYGTQVSYDMSNGQPKPIIKNLRNPKTVNKRRAEMGLESIEDYLKMIVDFQQQNMQKR